MKTLLLYLAAIFCPLTIFSQTIVPGGFVFGPFTLAGSPYIVTGSIMCGNLVIDPGVDVRFQYGSGLTVYNSIRAVGTAQQPITFEADDTTGWSNFSISNGGHAGLYIPGNTTDTSILEHCIIRDAKGLISNTWAVGVMVYATHFVMRNCDVYHNYIQGQAAIIRVSGAGLNPQITNNHIHHNYGRISGGISIEDAHGLISGNEFDHNFGSGGAAIRCSNINDPTGPLIENNSIHHNRSDFDGGGVMLTDGPVTFRYNTVAHNHSARAGSGVYILYAPAKIIGNLICNNSDSVYNNCGINDGGGGILINNGVDEDTAEIYNNIIANNVCWFKGGGIRVCGGGGTVFIENNHIVNNVCYGGFFSGGIHISEFIHASVRNNIIWGNRGYTPSWSLDSVQLLMGNDDTVALEYNCIEASAFGTVYQNVNTQITGNPVSNVYIYPNPPGFVNGTTGAGILYDATVADWHLTAGSPCIDAGTTTFLATPPQSIDYYGDQRVVGPSIDIGAVEYPTPEGISEETGSEFAVFPNPAGEFIRVTGCNSQTEIQITNVMGQVVVTAFYGSGIEVSELAKGVYAVSFVDASGIRVTQSFVKQ